MRTSEGETRVRRQRQHYAVACCIVLMVAPIDSAPQARHVIGSVRTRDDRPVSHADVDIDGIDLGAA